MHSSVIKKKLITKQTKENHDKRFRLASALFRFLITDKYIYAVIFSCVKNDNSQNNVAKIN